MRVAIALCPSLLSTRVRNDERSKDCRSGFPCKATSQQRRVDPPVWMHCNQDKSASFRYFTHAERRTHNAARLVALERLELPTFGLGNRCSVQLSYRALFISTCRPRCLSIPKCDQNSAEICLFIVQKTTPFCILIGMI